MNFPAGTMSLESINGSRPRFVCELIAQGKKRGNGI
jgi:hypothetical protein